MNKMIGLIFTFLISIHAQAGGILPTAAFNQQTSIKVKQLAVGGNHSCAILEDGSVKCWGSNANGQLLQGNTTNIGDTSLHSVKGSKAINLGTGRSAVSLALGLNHSCAILDNGSIKCWGLNSEGQLGLGHTNNMGDDPGEVGDGLPALNLGPNRTAVQISAGFSHTCAILDTRFLKCWGRGDEGALGQDNTINYGASGSNPVNTMLNVALGSRRAVQVIAGDSYTCVLLDDATVKCWGANGLGQLGQGSTSSIIGNASGHMASLNTVDLGTGKKVVQIAGGIGFHTCALLNDSTVKCWGRGDYGQLGQGNGSSIGTGAVPMGDSLNSISLGGTGRVIGIAAGAYHSCALMDDSSIKCWGGSIAGETGHGDTIPYGNGAGAMGSSLPVTDVGGLKVMQVMASALKTCVILEDATAKCFGEGDNGQMGQGSVTNIGDAAGQMGSNLKALDFGHRTSRLKKVIQTKSRDLQFRARPISAVGNHTCAILEDSTIKCWGNNSSGQLGQADTTNRGWAPNQMGDSLPPVNLGPGVKVLQVSAGGDHSCAVLSNSQIKCWGLNAQGQLGIGSYDSSVTALMGAALPEVNLGVGRSALQVSAGSNHTCAILDDHTVKCWGLNSSGELGQDVDTSSTNVPGAIVNLGGVKALQIGTGYRMSCALLETNEVKCWGYNDSGQAGQDSIVNVGTSTNTLASKSAINLGAIGAVSISVGVNSVCAVLANSSLKCWGYNGAGQLGQGNNSNYGSGSPTMASMPVVNLGIRRVNQVAAGYYHTCVLTEEGSVKCWGNNASGELGLGHTTAIGYPADMGANLVSVNLGAGRKAKSIVAGVAFTCATLDNSTVKCWGLSSDGQVGQGNNNSLGDNATEVGDGIPVVNLGLIKK